MYSGKRGGVVEPKGHICYFGDIILLLKYVYTKGEGAQIFGLFKHIYFMVIPLEQKFIIHRLIYCEMMGVKLLSAVDPQV